MEIIITKVKLEVNKNDKKILKYCVKKGRIKIG